MVHEQVDGERLSVDELFSNVVLLFFAGHETTASLMSGGLRELFIEREQLELLRHEPSLMENAVLEMLRMTSVAQLTVYTAMRDTEIRGVPLKQSMVVFCLIAAANRDPRMFSNPHKMDICRENAKKHLSFGGGIHFCLGAHLARVEAAIAIEMLLKEFPKLELIDIDKPAWRHSISLRALETQRARVN